MVVNQFYDFETPLSVKNIGYKAGLMLMAFIVDFLDICNSLALMGAPTKKNLVSNFKHIFNQL